MPYIAGTGVPASVTFRCPRCRTLRLFVSTGPETIYKCSGCEWSYTFAAGTNPLSTNGAVTAGVSTSLPFASGGTAFVNGSTLFIADGGSSEIVVVTGAPSATVVPISDLDFNHNSGVTVTLASTAPTYTSVVTVPGGP